MALKPCKECRKEVAVGAKTCPHCGTEWPAGQVTKPGTWGCLVAILAVVLFTCFQSSKPKTPEQRDAEKAQEAEMNARVACRLQVRERLKAPTTAEFSDITVTKMDGGVFGVTGKVTAQNSFGAMLTQAFVCKVDPAANTVESAIVR